MDDSANTGPDLSATRKQLIRDVLVLQVKLLLGAARDLALTPVTLTAAAIDLILSRRQPPRYFHWILRLGERSERWIDTWSAGRHGDEEPQRGSVDSLLNSVEEIVRDPKVGAYRARVLKRWAERQVSRARARERLGVNGPAQDTAKPD
jgi:hypothetical protein